MSTHIRSTRQAAMEVSTAPGKSDLLQRQSACGGSPGPAGHCHDSDKEELQVQRSTSTQTQWSTLTPIGREESTFKSRSSDGAAPALINKGFGHDFSSVSVNSTSGQRVQTKLTISQPGDGFEREADRVAEQVMRSPDPADLKEIASIESLPRISRWVGISQIGRQPAEDEEEQAPEEEFSTASLLSLKEASGSPHAPSPQVTGQIHSMRGSGQPLSSELRNFFEPRFGHDFSRVRVHTDARAAETTKALNARAYTLGSDVAFASSEYKPETPAGRLLLAHELTHVVQQSDQVQTVMRACDCSKMGASKASSDLDSFLRSNFPQLNSSEYCVTSAATSKYNCFAWSVGDTSKWLDKEVDTVHGNNNGKLEFSDFDSMYAKSGLTPVIGSTPSDAQVALYGKGTTPTHAARRRSDAGCGNFESKLGGNVRISHYPDQLEGGTVYGNINRYYVPKAKPKP